MTPEEIKAEMKKIKVPLFIGFAEKFWFKVGRYLIPALMISLLPVGIATNKVAIQHVDAMWSVLYIIMGVIAGLGLLMLGSHFVEKRFVKKQAKRLGITVYQWNAYAKEIGLVSY
jgi:hypothetical protein